MSLASVWTSSIFDTSISILSNTDSSTLTGCTSHIKVLVRYSHNIIRLEQRTIAPSSVPDVTNSWKSGFSGRVLNRDLMLDSHFKSQLVPQGCTTYLVPFITTYIPSILESTRTSNWNSSKRRCSETHVINSCWVLDVRPPFLRTVFLLRFKILAKALWIVARAATVQ